MQKHKNGVPSWIQLWSRVLLGMRNILPSSYNDCCNWCSKFSHSSFSLSIFHAIFMRFWLIVQKLVVINQLINSGLFWSQTVAYLVTVAYQLSENHFISTTPTTTADSDPCLAGDISIMLIRMFPGISQIETTMNFHSKCHCHPQQLQNVTTEMRFWDKETQQSLSHIPVVVNSRLSFILSIQCSCATNNARDSPVGCNAPVIVSPWTGQSVSQSGNFGVLSLRTENNSPSVAVGPLLSVISTFCMKVQHDDMNWSSCWPTPQSGHESRSKQNLKALEWSSAFHSIPFQVHPSDRGTRKEKQFLDNCSFASLSNREINSDTLPHPRPR